MKKNVFDGGSLDEAIQRLPGGKSRMDAYLEAIRRRTPPRTTTGG